MKIHRNPRLWVSGKSSVPCALQIAVVRHLGAFGGQTFLSPGGVQGHRQEKVLWWSFKGAAQCFLEALLVSNSNY